MKAFRTSITPLGFRSKARAPNIPFSTPEHVLLKATVLKSRGRVSYRAHGQPSVQSAYTCFKRSRLWVSSSRTRLCSARASAEHRPCFQRACRDRANLPDMRGPVLAPACGIFRLALPGPDTTRRTLFENRRTCWLRFGHGNVAQWPILRALRIVHLPLK